MKSRTFLSGLLLIILFACSKDDNHLPPEEPVGTLQGIFTDAQVEGLKYTNETYTGFTDENGAFNYEEGETVTFYVGDIKLGSALAVEEISPIDIASAVDADINTLEVQNIAALLQTLDEDGNPDNGIKISPEVAAAISLTEIDFSSPIIQILGKIVMEIFEDTGVSLEVVYPELAATHLAQTLEIEYTPAPSFTLNFLPTFTNYFGRDSHSFFYKEASLALHWVHEFDEQGNLIKSLAYEKYPSRILYEFSFTEYNETGSNVNVEIKNYNYFNWDEYELENYFIDFDESYFIQKITSTQTYSNVSVRLFKEYNSEKWVTLQENYNSIGELLGSAKMEYDEKGNVLRTTGISTDGNQGPGREYTYTEFGDPASYSLYRSEDDFNEFQYFYRSDKTLEKYQQNFESGLASMEFTEDETYYRWTAYYEDEEHFIFTYGEELVEEYYWRDNPTNIFWYKYDGNGYSSNAYKYEWYEDGILRERHIKNDNNKYVSFEYFYNNGNVEWKEFYDEEGNWIYTEYYDEEGNLIETKYQ